MRSDYAGIFFISAGALLLEIALTRIFSVSRWYHFAFMVVSIALLGFAASGSFLNLVPTIKSNKYALFVSSLAFSLSVIISFYISDKIEMDPYKIVLNPYLVASIAVYYVLLSLPFLCAGLCIGILLSKYSGNAGAIYGVNLAGSAVGCALIFTFSVAGSKIILVCALLGVAASFFFATTMKYRLISVAVIFIMVLLPGSIYSVTMSPYKSLSLALNYPDSEIVFTEWNTISRVDIVKSPLRHAPGLSLHYTKGLSAQLGLTVDGDNISPLVDPDEFVEYVPTAAAYVNDPESVLIVHPQGIDVVCGKYFGAIVTVTEGNPLIVESAEKVSDVYKNVQIVYQDGRSFLSSTDTVYDVIQISLSESLFASSVGLYGFNESYTFTEEAFEQYIHHLEDDGILIITRWLVVPPRELPKIVSLIINTVESPQDHTIIFRSYSTNTVLLKKTPFTHEEIYTITTFCKERGYDLVWTPEITKDHVNKYNKFSEPYFYNLVKSQFSNNKNVQKEYLFNIEAPTDTKPFFFNFFKWRKLPELYQSVQGRWQPFFEGGFMAVLILVQAFLVSVVLIVAPLKKLAMTRFTLLYFGFIGLGFMFVEISLMQQLILFLGHPVYSVTLVLAIILLFSGVGSYTSGTIGWKKGFTGIVVSLLFLGGSLSFVIHTILGINIFGKVLAGLILLAPLSVCMGIPFPTGIKTIPPDQVPYAWCVNGCASVIGSVLAVIIALSYGFCIVLLMGAFWYGFACIVRYYYT
ncbi:MAG: hypothetical protein PVF58_02775 [Candidatus Methanofastidiosia archaeon]|jgi:hypothetical protein